MLTAMRRIAPLLTLIVTWPALVPCARAACDYDIEVRLDEDRHALAGQMRVRWTNSASEPTDELWWHLYLNAFASPETSMMRALGRRGLRGGRGLGSDSGWIRITAMRTTDGRDLLPTLEFVRPDDGNPEDFTVAKVSLAAPVAAGAALELEVDFDARLPAVVARSGFSGDFHMVGQWFPKLGVFEDLRSEGPPRSQWNCHQYHATSEFYSEFGTYRVTVDVPAGWVVGASGVEIERQEEGGRQQLVYRAADVHDFAWCAAPGEQMIVVEADFDPGRDVPLGWLEDTVDLLERSAAELELPPSHLRLLLPRAHADLAPRMVRAARWSIAWFGLRYGPYPYPQLTVVSPPPGAEEAGGMEYPTLITTGTSRLLALPLLRRVPWIEMLTVHEFGHQYFYGLLASNEFEEAWLDEGLTSYATAECLERLAADGLVATPTGMAWGLERLELGTVEPFLQVARPSWEYPNREAYARAVYTKAALVMKTLAGVVGEERMARALRAYVERFERRHPRGEDLQQVLEQSLGEELGWFFDQAVRSDATADWAVGRVRSSRARAPSGLRWDGAEWVAREGDGSPRDTWTTQVQVVRRGSLAGPVEVAVTFADGAVERRTWDGRDRWVELRLEAPERATAVVVDPDGVWVVETRRTDNYWRSPEDADGTRPVLWWLTDAARLLVELAVAPWS